MKDKGMDKYEIEEAARTLMRAEEIKGDGKKMKAVSAHLGKMAAQAQAASLPGKVRAGMKKAFPSS